MRYLLLITCWLLIAGCNREAYQGMQLSPLTDSLVQYTLPRARKYKFLAPVTITIQKGEHNVATSTTTGKIKAQAAAIGPNSSAISKQNVTPWWVFGLFIVGGIVLGIWARGKLHTLASIAGIS